MEGKPTFNWNRLSKHDSNKMLFVVDNHNLHMSGMCKGFLNSSFSQNCPKNCIFTHEKFWFSKHNWKFLDHLLLSNKFYARSMWGMSLKNKCQVWAVKNCFVMKKKNDTKWEILHLLKRGKNKTISIELSSSTQLLRVSL